MLFISSEEGNDREEEQANGQLYESTVATDDIPDVPSNSFLMRRSRTPTPVREKREKEGKETFPDKPVRCETNLKRKSLF